MAASQTFKQRRAAVEDARKLDGVYEVKDELTVHLRDDVRDDEISGAALQSLIWDAQVPSDSIDVKVASGWATLTGKVEFQFQSDAAFDDVAMVRGVGGITNKIKVGRGSLAGGQARRRPASDIEQAAPR